MAFIGNFRYRQHVKAPSTDTVTFESDRVRKGELVKVLLAQVLDSTTANKKLVLGIRDAEGNDHYLHQVQETLTFEAHLEGEVYLIEGEKFIGIVTSPTLSDECFFTVDGEKYRIPGV